jgi:hypothetical protein
MAVVVVVCGDDAARDPCLAVGIIETAAGGRVHKRPIARAHRIGHVEEQLVVLVAPVADHEVRKAVAVAVQDREPASLKAEIDHASGALVGELDAVDHHLADGAGRAEQQEGDCRVEKAVSAHGFTPRG